MGKSTLFNKIIGERISIVEDTPGVTRDRIYAEGEWLTKKFILIDTGGIEPRNDDIIIEQMSRQAKIAIEMADAIVFMVDVKSGMTSADKDIAAMLKRSGKPIVLACNKVDNIGDVPMGFYEFFNLGLDEPIAISSTHGLGTGDLLDKLFSYVNFDETQEEDDEVIKVAPLGGVCVEESVLRYGKAVLQLKSRVGVEQTVLFKSFEAIFVVNVEKFHRFVRLCVL